ncbi:MAG TPA: zinc ribbon domain-containing protein [Ktedonobacteraceae bacterium]
MDSQPQQRFCVNCGQHLAPGAAFCAGCGTQVGSPPADTPGQFSAGAHPGYPPPYTQAPMQAQDDLLLAGLASGYVASRMGRPSQQGARRPRSRLQGYGCLLLFLVVLVGPFIGLALTKGLPHLIFTYVAVGMVVFIFLLFLIGMLATRRGRKALSEGCADGCLDALLGGLLGGG